eukprot:701502-Prymnesium_polylepis.1
MPKRKLSQDEELADLFDPVPDEEEDDDALDEGAGSLLAPSDRAQMLGQRRMRTAQDMEEAGAKYVGRAISRKRFEASSQLRKRAAAVEDEDA